MTPRCGLGSAPPVPSSGRGPMSKPTTDQLHKQLRAPLLSAGESGYDEARAVRDGSLQTGIQRSL